MRMIVCIKQVPSSNEVRLDPVTNTILRDGRQSVTNPYDSFALEQAVRIKEALGGKITALSMGIPAAQTMLRDAMSRGADEAVLLSDRAFAGADTLATAYTLAAGIERIGDFDLILCGKMAIDGDTAQIGPELAENLDVPHVSGVFAFVSIGEDELICKYGVDNGYALVKVTLPAVLTVEKDGNMPRLPSIRTIRAAQAGPLHVWGAEALGVEKDHIGLMGSATQVVRTYVPQHEHTCRMLTGGPQAVEVIQELIL